MFRLPAPPLLAPRFPFCIAIEVRFVVRTELYCFLIVFSTWWRSSIVSHVALGVDRFSNVTSALIVKYRFVVDPLRWTQLSTYQHFSVPVKPFKYHRNSIWSRATTTTMMICLLTTKNYRNAAVWPQWNPVRARARHAQCTHTYKGTTTTTVGRSLTFTWACNSHRSSSQCGNVAHKLKEETKTEIRMNKFLRRNGHNH